MQVRQVNLYTPNNENVSGGWFFCVERFLIVLLVRKAIFRSAFLNTVRDVGSFLTYMCERSPSGFRCLWSLSLCLSVDRRFVRFDWELIVIQINVNNV